MGLKDMFGEVQKEIERDLDIQRSGVMAGFVELPVTTGEEYVQVGRAHL